MKKLMNTVVAAGLAAALLASTPVYAGDEAIAAVGGFLGGLVVGSIASDYSRPTYTTTYYTPAPAYYAVPASTTTVYYPRRSYYYSKPVSYYRTRTYYSPSYTTTMCWEDSWY